MGCGRSKKQRVTEAKLERSRHLLAEYKANTHQIINDQRLEIDELLKELARIRSVYGE